MAGEISPHHLELCKPFARAHNVWCVGQMQWKPWAIDPKKGSWWMLESLVSDNLGVLWQELLEVEKQWGFRWLDPQASNEPPWLLPNTKENSGLPVARPSRGESVKVHFSGPPLWVDGFMK
jgi:hypothetical protein